LGYYQENLQDKVIAIWGLAFKPQTDDLREAPSLTIISNLLEARVRLQAYDPVAMPLAKEILADKPGITFSSSRYEALQGADALLIMTEWTIFREPDFERMKSMMKAPVIFDGRNIYQPEKLAKLGFKYFFMGQKQDK
jgi:UDPglucose 6-dehydrogenase